MKLNQEQLELLAECAVAAAYQAGHFIERKSKEDIVVERKSGGESEASQVVTEVDRMAQDIILDSLKPTFDIFDLGLLTEESEDAGSRLVKDYFWCIDPLDGTLAFIRSSHGFSVSIALVSRSGEPEIGVIYDPTEKILYKGIKGSGATRNGNPFLVVTNPDSNTFSFINDISFYDFPRFDEIDEGCKDFVDRLQLGEYKQVKHGGGALNACWTAENAPACYFKYPRPNKGGGSLWDFSASACILKEAGAIVTDIHGNALDLNRPDSTFMNHRGILFASGQAVADEIMKLYKKMNP